MICYTMNPESILKLDYYMNTTVSLKLANWPLKLLKYNLSEVALGVNGL